MRIRSPGQVVVATALLVGCNALFGIEEGTPATGDAGGNVDSSVGGDSSSDSGSDSSRLDSSGPDSSGLDSPTETGVTDTAVDAPLCAGPTLYVSVSTGSDANPGCASGAPKKTIAAALAAASVTPTITEIDVCKGTYNETPLALAAVASLKGGFSCTTWTRTATYGYPTFDGTNVTVIQNAAASVAGATLDVTGSSITSAVVVDGFSILGPTSGTTSNAASAIICTGGASPTLSNNELSGGSLTAPTGIASTGVFVLTGANPVITGNKINGGSGTIPPTSNADGSASVGIMTDGSSTGVQIVGNIINGGSGTASNSLAGGSAAVRLQGTATPGPSYTVQGNTLVGGTGTSVGATATLGLFVNGTANLVLDSNSIDGGGGSTGVFCSSGVNVQSTGTTTITANRVYAGNCALSSTTTAPVGVLLKSSGPSPVLHTNLIHGGTATSAVSPAAINVSGVTGADIRHNTLIGGVSSGSFPAALLLNAGTTSTTVASNILAAAGASAGLAIGQCPDAGAPALQAFENNLVFGTSLGLFKWNGCFGGTQYHTVDGMTAQLLASQSGATVQGNLTVASSCTTDGGTDSGCLVSPGCTTAQTCLTTFFGGWDVASYGYKNLLPTAPFSGACPTQSVPPVGNGWTIGVTPAPPCGVTRSSLDDHALTGLGVDLYGNCRTGTPTMGAEEDSSATCQ